MLVELFVIFGFDSGVNIELLLDNPAYNWMTAGTFFTDFFGDESQLPELIYLDERQVGR